MPVAIFKIIDQALWQELQSGHGSVGSADDQRDGYVHFSTAEQLPSTFEKYYASRWRAGEALYLLECDAKALDQSKLRFELSRGGALFPHWYGLLTAAMLVRFEPIDQACLQRSGIQSSA